MAIFRIQKDKENPFVQLHKGFLMNPNLSFKAKGILGYLLSRPDDFKIYEKEIAKYSRDGIDSVRTGLQELAKEGYIEITKDLNIEIITIK